MNLIRQSRLVFRRGASDKLYEIELCETGASGPNRFVVNYRYGRRGGTFKEGSKTVSPVSREEADRIFDHLEEAQLLKGYVREGAAPAAGSTSGGAASPSATGSAPAGRSSLGSRLGSRGGAPSAPASPPPRAPAPRASTTAGTSAGTSAARRGSDPRASRVLERLDEGDGRSSHTPSRLRAAFTSRRRRRVTRTPAEWPLTRAIWRAGELQLVEAVPRLLELIGTKDSERDYCIVWALGRIGDRRAIGELNRIYRDPTSPEMVGRMAGEAMRAMLDEGELTTFREELARRLPTPLNQLALQSGEGADDALAEALAGHLQSGKKRAWKAVVHLYGIDTPTVRVVLKSLLRQVPLAFPGFRAVRQIFKAAELRMDAEIFGLIAWRFAKTRASSGGGYYARRSGEYAYGTYTRAYMRRRVWRTLKRMGELGYADFVRMAVGLLLPFSDDDARGTGTRWYRGQQTTLDGFASYWAFNYLLYANSRLRHPDQRYLRWYIQSPTRAGRRSSVRSRRGNLTDRSVDNQDNHRTEAFPELWDAHPEGLLHLLDESRCAQVHEFAATALRDNEEACRRLPVGALTMLLNSDYEITARLGLDLARARYDGSKPDTELTLACAHCQLSEARRMAFDWINDHKASFGADGQFLGNLVTSPQADTRTFARGLIRGLTLTETIARHLTARLIASLMALGKDAEQTAADVADLLFRTFRAHLVDLGEPVIKDLLRHRLQAVQSFGADVLLAHNSLAASPPEQLLVALFESKFPEVRALGLRLIGGLSDAELAARQMLLVALTTHSEEDLRVGAIEHIKRLAAIGDFGGQMAEALIRALVGQKIRGDGAAYAVEALRAALKPYLPSLPIEAIWRLLRSKTKPGQELGGLLLECGVKPESLSVDEMARLGGHDILTVREAAWSFYRRSVDRVKADMNAAVRIFDVDWDDSRAFAFEFFSGDAFGADDFTPQVLVGICDSVRPDVQLFGRRLITQYFKDADGVEYMLKLAEHPSVDIQLFVSQYLEQYAAGQPERVEALAAYFAGVLGRVNKGGVAKARVFSFLRAQAEADERTARAIVDLLARQSATIAITDRARCIETMLAIHQRWPDIEVPLTIKPPADRRSAQGV